jgi:hypothetical protein
MKCDDCKGEFKVESLKAFQRTVWPEDGEEWLQPGAPWFTETKYCCRGCAKKYDE